MNVIAERRESVRLELVDSGFSTGMVRAAAATALLNKELSSLSRRSTTSIGKIDDLTKSTHALGREFDGLPTGNIIQGLDGASRSARDADGSINQLTGRLRVLAEVGAILAPSLAPAGGVLIAGVAGLANQMGIAAVAGGVLIGSLQGVGDALGAMNKAQLEPTEKNMEKARDALEALSPAARDFAKEAFALKPALVALRDLGAEELMPGLTASLNNLENLGPRVAAIMQAFGGVLGDIAEDSSASLASERWAGFFEFIAEEGPATLGALATTVGDLTHGLAELWQAFSPLNNDFSSWLMDIADGFDGWATGLSATQGFTDFIDYVRTTGPQVADLFGSMFNAIVQLVEASAPLGGPVLEGLTAVADVVAAIADSDLGTPIMAGVTALALLNRSLAVTASLSKVSLSSGLFAGLGTASTGIKKGAGSIRADFAAISSGLVAFGHDADKAGAAADRMKQRLATGAGLAGVAVAATGAADGIGLTNTASLALMGTMAGPWGAAIGAGAGLLLDWKASGDQATESMEAFQASLSTMDVSGLEATMTRLQGLQAATGDDFLGADLLASRVEVTQQAIDDLAWSEKKAAIEAKGAALEFLNQTGANVDLAKWSRKSTDDIKAQAAAIGEAQDSANATAESFVTLGESLNDGKVSLSDWIKEMAFSADALRNFTANSRKAAKNGLNDGLIESLQQAGEEGARRMRQLANASEGEIGRANRAWRKGQQAMKEYNDYKVPPKKVTADTSRAMQSFREVDTYLSSLNGKTATTYVNTVRTVTGPMGAAVTGRRADGGSIPKDGRPYADRFLYMLAPGEEVISNRHGQADAFRADRAAGRIPGYADGGTTGEDPKKKRRHRFFDVNDGTAGLQAALDALTARTDDQTAALDAQRSALEKSTSAVEFWADKMSEVASGTVSGFNTGLFDKDSNPWGEGAGGGALFNLNRDNAGLEARGSLQAQLAAAGLSADALAAVLSQGSNADLQGILNSGSAAQINAAFNQRAALQGSVGGAAGQLAYGGQYAAAQQAQQQATAAVTQQLAEVQKATAATQRMEARINTMAMQVERLNADQPERTGEAVGRVINGASASGHREKQWRGR